MAKLTINEENKKHSVRDAHGCGKERYATHTTTGAQSEQAPQRLRGRGVESGLAHFVPLQESPSFGIARYEKSPQVSGHDK